MRLLVFISIVMASCFNFTVEPHFIEEMKEEVNKSDTLKISYLALGDSYTIGEGVSEKDRFPNQLISSDLDTTFMLDEFKIIARTGWTTRNLLDGMDREELTVGTYDFITLLIGVNNQYQGKPVDLYKEEFEILIDRAIELVEGDPLKVIVVSIPDYGVTPFAANRDSEKIAKEIDLYNSINEEFAKEKGTRYVYITDLTKAAANDLSLLANDQLHPSGKLYAQWVERIIPEVKEIILTQ